jgi:hypothetical protein
MTRLLQHPRCKDFFRVSPNPMILKFVTLTTKNKNVSSQNTIKILKSLRKRSFYKAIEIVSNMTNVVEKNYILQLLYSAVTYTENNHYANLLKLWVDDVYITKTEDTNRFIHQNKQILTSKYTIIIKIGFEYKDAPLKRESLW